MCTHVPRIKNQDKESLLGFFCGAQKYVSGGDKEFEV
jgi:hypothetical protein